MIRQTHVHVSRASKVVDDIDALVACPADRGGGAKTWETAILEGREKCWRSGCAAGSETDAGLCEGHAEEMTRW